MVTTPPNAQSVWWKRWPVRRLLVVIALAAIALLSAPRYWSGQWAWRQPAEVVNIEPLRLLREQGLVTLPDWQIQGQRTFSIGNHQWSMQEIQPLTANPAIQSDKSSYLLLRPQDWHDQEPQVEWVDLDGFWSRVWMGQDAMPTWKTDSRQRLQFSVALPGGEERSISAQYLRGWHRQQTFAMLQWYTWPTGGTPKPADWFWADQRSRWQTGDRAPWIAVSLLVPVPPFADIEDAAIEKTLMDLGRSVEAQLLETVLIPAQSPPV